jgi:hypothetical protein
MSVVHIDPLNVILVTELTLDVKAEPFAGLVRGERQEGSGTRVHAWSRETPFRRQMHVRRSDRASRDIARVVSDVAGD